MNYNDIMQKAGKQINPVVSYYENGELKKIEKDDVKNVKPFLNCSLVGTVMRGLSIESTFSIPSDKIYFENEAKYNEYVATKKIGPYFLKETPEYNADSKTYTHFYYDNFLKSMVPYKKISISFPTSVLSFFKQLCLECGYTTSIESLPNGNRIMESDVYDGIDFTYRDVFDDIGAATATLFEEVDGDIRKVELGKNEDAVVIDDDLLKNENIEILGHCGPFNSIILSRSSDLDKIYKRDESLTEWIEFEIKDNQLMNDNNRSDYLDELYEQIAGIEYYVYDLELVGYGGFRPLQKIIVSTNGNKYESYVFNNEEEFTQGYKEVIYNEFPEQSKMDYTTSSKTDKGLSQLYIIVDKQNKKIESVSSTVDDTNSKISKVEQTVDELNSKIQNIADITVSRENDFGRIAFENLANCKPLYIKIHPTDRDISVLYPAEEIYPSDDLFLDERVPNLVFKNTKTKEKFEFEFPELFQYKGTYDEIFIDFVNGKYELIKKIGADENEFIDVRVGDNLNGKILKLNFPEDIDLTTDRILLTGPTKYYYGDEANLEIKVLNGRIIINCWLVSPFYQMSVDVDITGYKAFTLLKNDNSYTFDNVISISEEALNGHYFQLENPNYGQKVVLANPIVEELELPNIVLSEGDYEVFLDNDDIGYLYAKMLLKSDFSDMYATKYELKTSITQTENSIKESVSATIEDINEEITDIQGSMELKLDIDKLISQFNLAVNQVIINSDNFKLDAQGNITMASGAKIIGGYGLLTNITINATILSREFVGSGLMLPLHTGEELIFQFTMPKGFHVEKAYVILNHAPCKITRLLDGTMEEVTYTGYCRNLKLYKYTNVSNLSFEYEEYNWNPPRFAGGTLTEIPNAFGSSGFTGSSSSLSRKNSIDIKEHISTSEDSEVFNVLKIKSSNTVPEVDTPSYYQQAGVCGATLVIVGYMAVFE